VKVIDGEQWVPRLMPMGGNAPMLMICPLSSDSVANIAPPPMPRPSQTPSPLLLVMAHVKGSSVR